MFKVQRITGKITIVGDDDEAAILHDAIMEHQESKGEPGRMGDDAYESLRKLMYLIRDLLPMPSS